MNENMTKLYEMLEEFNIPCELAHQPMWDAPQIIIYRKGERISDVISHWGSYGGQEGLLEVYLESIDDVYGYLSAKEAFSIIMEDYCKE